MDLEDGDYDFGDEDMSAIELFGWSIVAIIALLLVGTVLTHLGIL